MKRKTLIALVCTLLLLVGAAGGTLAWLTDKTDTVTNTFTVGDIEITLDETLAPDGKPLGDNEWSAQMLPGETYSKNPQVSVDGTKTNVDCYLFVKFEANEAAKEYLTYTSMLEKTGSGWSKLEDVTGVDDVWYRVVSTTDTTKSWNLLDENEVTVNGDKVTAATMEAAAKAELTYTAYAVQISNGENEFTPAEAWAKLQ